MWKSHFNVVIKELFHRAVEIAGKSPLLVENEDQIRVFPHFHSPYNKVPLEMWKLYLSHPFKELSSKRGCGKLFSLKLS